MTISHDPFLGEEEGKSSNDPSDLINAIHVFSFLEKEVLELLSTSVILESFMNEMELNKILDTNDLVILKEGRISAHHDNTLIGCMEKGRLLSSLLNLLMFLDKCQSGQASEDHPEGVGRGKRDQDSNADNHDRVEGAVSFEHGTFDTIDSVQVFESNVGILQGL